MRADRPSRLAIPPVNLRRICIISAYRPLLPNVEAIASREGTEAGAASRIALGLRRISSGTCLACGPRGPTNDAWVRRPDTRLNAHRRAFLSAQILKLAGHVLRTAGTVP